MGEGGLVNLYNDSGSIHLIADVAGWFPEGASYAPLVPARVLDTREGVGAPKAAVGPKSSIQLQVLGRGGVPAGGVGAVVLNVTATVPTAPSFVTVWPAGAERPLASNLNVRTGQTVPNLVIARVEEGGLVNLYNDSGSIHLIADVAGWFPSRVDPGAAPSASTDPSPGQTAAAWVWDLEAEPEEHASESPADPQPEAEPTEGVLLASDPAAGQSDTHIVSEDGGGPSEQDTDPCSLVTVEEWAAVAGGSSQPELLEDGDACGYRNDGDTWRLGVGAFTSATDRRWLSEEERNAGQPVAELGDAATWLHNWPTSQSSTLVVQKGPVDLVLELSTRTAAPSEELLAAAKRLARPALERL